MQQTPLPVENPYEQFASVYNSHWGRNSLHFLPIYQKQALEHLPEQARILDLCCGSGQFSEALTLSGYRVVGVDLSDAQLDFARQNAPGASFLAADIRHFQSEDIFDAAVCVYDSLNHLLTFDDLEAAFETVHRCLKPTGVFAFDMNMEAKYQEAWRGEFAVSGSDDVYRMVSRVDHHQRLATLIACRKSSLEFDAEESRFLFRQTWYSEVEIVRGLKWAGFEKIKAISLNAPNLNDPERMLFVCRKP